MEVKGTIFRVLEIQSGTSGTRSWRKKSFVIEVPGNFPKKICFDIWGDNIDNFVLNEGEEVIVSFDLESKEYNGKWFTNAKAWKIQNDTSGSSDTPTPTIGAPAKAPMPSAQDEPKSAVEFDDDLPF